MYCIYWYTVHSLITLIKNTDTIATLDNPSEEATSKSSNFKEQHETIKLLNDEIMLKTAENFDNKTEQTSAWGILFYYQKKAACFIVY